MQVVVTHSRRPLAALRALGPLRFFAAVATSLGTVRDPFGWNKTEHGLARTSRSGLLVGSRAAGARRAAVELAWRRYSRSRLRLSQWIGFGRARRA